MTTAGQPSTTTAPGNTEGLIRTASPDVLLAIGRAAHQLRHQPQVVHFDNPNSVPFYHKTDDLRRLIVKTMRNDYAARAAIKKIIAGMATSGGAQVPPPAQP